jgi:hypothetical protein
MKCNTNGCRAQAEAVKLGTAQAKCLEHAGHHVAEAIRNGENFEEWTHIDGAFLCEGGCYVFYDDFGSDGKACESCLEKTCSDCMNDDGECKSCVANAEYAKDVEHSWSHR